MNSKLICNDKLKKNILRNLILSLSVFLLQPTPARSQDYLEFSSTYENCDVEIDYEGETASSECRLIFTYNGENINFHFVSDAGEINMITNNLDPDTVSVEQERLYLAPGTYPLYKVRLSLKDGSITAIEGKGKCEKSERGIACVFSDNLSIKFSAVAY